MFSFVSLITGDKNLELPHRVLNFILFSFFIFVIFAEIENIIIGEPSPVHGVAVFFFVYFGIGYYYSRVKKKWHLLSHLTVILSFVGIVFFYIFDGGLFCGNGFFIIVDVAIIVTVFEGKKRYYYLFFLIALTFFLIFFEMSFPEIFIEITKKQCAANIVLAFVIAVISSIFILVLFIVQLEEQKSAIEKLSKKDFLTGMLNRRGIFEKLDFLVENSKLKNYPFSIILADIDDFKQVNDKYGHLCGDTALKEVAERMKEALRKEDIIGRWGGEEFIVILPFADLKSAKKVAKRIRSNMLKSLINCDEHLFYLTLTFGVGMFNPSLSLDKNLALIDIALYKGKVSGKNCIVVVD